MSNDKPSVYFLPLLLSVTLVIGLILGNLLTPKIQTTSSGSKTANVSKLEDVLHILNEAYVDSINSEELFEETLSDMLHKLDPHSNYIPAKDLQAVNEGIEGKFGGVGIRFFIIRDTVCVTNIIPGSPSQVAGIQPGDQIIQVDGNILSKKGVSNENVLGKLKGDPGTAVALMLKRGNKIIKKRLIRGTIPISSISCSYLIQPGIGFIKIDAFSLTTAEEFRKAASLLKQNGMQKLIIDLRDNSGGVLTAATQIADEFLPDGLLLLTTKGAHAAEEVYRSTAGGLFEKMPLTILINSNSASASEILAGAIQDNDRGMIVGRRSFGKGLVQKDIQLNDNSDLRLTIARYYTPSGRCIQKPYTKGYDTYMHDAMDRIDNGELYHADSANAKKGKRFKTLKGRYVYEGGGIMPDLFVPYDSSGQTLYYTELRYSQAFTAFAYDFISDKRSKWNNIEAFQSFTISPSLLNDFLRYAEKEYAVKRLPSDLKWSEVLIKRTLKLEIARQLWVEAGYFAISNKTDADVLRAISYLKYH